MPAAFLFDLAGTLHTEAAAIPGGPEALARLTERGIPFGLVTNTTSRSRRGIVERLAEFGYRIPPERVQTPVTSALAVARMAGCQALVPFIPEPALEDLSGFELVGGTAGRSGHGTGIGGGSKRAVVVGDLGRLWTFELLQEAFEHLNAGAMLLALSKDRYFRSERGITLDAGPFVAALEFATGMQARVAGKPSGEFFASAVASLGLPASTSNDQIVMVGDDLWSDIEGAQRAGLRAWLVRTGKFSQTKLDESGIRPDRVIASVAEVA